MSAELETRGAPSTSTGGARSVTGGFPDLVHDILEAMPVALIVVDAERRIVLANRELERLLDYRREDLVGRPVDILVPEPLRASHASLQLAYLAAPVARQMGGNRDLLARCRDGRLIPVEIGLKPFDGPHGPMVIATVVDISTRKALEQHDREAHAELERKVMERTAALERSNDEKQRMLDWLERARLELERLRRHDPLTGLDNRREFDERVALEQQRADRNGSPMCVAMLDLDHFKFVNDRYGHALGDEVLRHVGMILRQQCRVVDIVSRHGGEEFAVAFPDTAPSVALVICERIRSAVASHAWHELRPALQVTISIGMALRDPGEDAGLALDRADNLLYVAKRRGRNRVESDFTG